MGTGGGMGAKMKSRIQTVVGTGERIMTVLDLIGFLSKFPPAARVVVDGYEGGLEDVIVVDAVNIQADVNQDADYYGRHLVDAIHPAESAVWLKGVKARGGTLTVQDMERLKGNSLWYPGSKT